jgi:hypothetical protein
MLQSLWAEGQQMLIYELFGVKGSALFGVEQRLFSNTVTPRSRLRSFLQLSDTSKPSAH